MVQPTVILNPRFREGEKRDEMPVTEPRVADIIRKITPELPQWQRISNWISLRVLGMTVFWFCLTIGVMRSVNTFAVSCLAFCAIAILHHRCNIIRHEAAHRLLFRNRLTNDLVGHHLFGALNLSPSTFRFYHFKHHRELGRDTDPDYPEYAPFPMGSLELVGFFFKSLVGVWMFLQFLKEFRGMLGRTPNIRAYHEQRGAWPALKAWAPLALAQGFVLALFIVSGGSLIEFLIFWILPQLTLTRALMAVRIMGEHATRGDSYPLDTRYLATLPCGLLERALFGPLGFNYHAEHHLFPSVPWYRLRKLHRRLIHLPEYAQIVSVRKSYLRAVFENGLRRQTG